MFVWKDTPHFWMDQIHGVQSRYGAKFWRERRLDVSDNPEQTISRYSRGLPPWKKKEKNGDVQLLITFRKMLIFSLIAKKWVRYICILSFYVVVFTGTWNQSDRQPVLPPTSFPTLSAACANLAPPSASTCPSQVQSYFLGVRPKMNGDTSKWREYFGVSLRWKFCSQLK